MEQKEFIEEVWSIKKILAAIAIVLFLIGGAYVLYKNNQMTKNQMAGGNQKQTEDRKSAAASFSLPSAVFESGIREKVNSLRKQVNDLNAVEIASSSPQVQKILKDIQDLKQYPRDQAKEACQKLCSNL